MRPLRILTWQAHGNYLHALSQLPHQFYLMTDRDSPGHGWPSRSNIRPLPASKANAGQFDCILFHRREHYLDEQHRYLTEAQRRLPRIYVEHAAPGKHAGGRRHPVDDPDVLLVHVTAYNALMWDNGQQTIRIIDQGVMPSPGSEYGGDRPCGVMLGNTLWSHSSRRSGNDIYRRLCQRIPLEVIPTRCRAFAGDDYPLCRLPASATRYRFLFHPGHDHTLDPGVIAGMMSGMPVIGLATGAMASVIQNGISGYVDTDIDKLAAHMQELLDNPPYAFALGRGAQRRARECFGMPRFLADWNAALDSVTDLRAKPCTD
ncbi:glycosyltransferase [Actimicrobium sp. CCC2.4]|uniref:glycosyltransferase n=1 Tax=Actimicrobium sp. CCC2.4 TaxID=3048606 RepID=UPI002AC960B7|nr:glycosyltransferase [Actimicrobium sp. CCC2.4]MEB0135887.1 glycosyltransferase [Actimicrobium sp. CCC2.4]WPX33363.1 glycosyltransferase [Actimicrobium sp. CCC2.4]